MKPHDLQDLPEDLPDYSEKWVRLCDDFVTLEGQCAFLCELLIYLSRRSEPLDLASQHGAELFGNQLKQQLAGFKQQLYQVRPD